MKSPKKLAFLLAVAIFPLALSLPAFLSSASASPVMAEPDPHDHTGMTEWTSTNSLPTEAGSYYLASNVTITSTWAVPSGITNLCLNGHGIRKNGGLVIDIDSGRTLNLYDCDTTTEHKYTVPSPQPNGAGLATVDDSLTEGYQTFKGGYITGGTGDNGAALSITGTFNMYGGTIIGNNCGSGDGNGCIRLYSPAAFDMYGGSLLHNFGRTGGALFVETGTTFTLHGGSITANQSSVRGAAIFTRGTTNIRGGEITGNWGPESTVTNWGGNFEMTGGESL